VAPDLIPPPSPAGRPDADGAEEQRADDAFERAAQPVAEPAPEGPSPFRGRFGFVWGALVGIAVCAVAVTAVLATTGGDNGPRLAANWSSWKPDTSRMVDGAADIAAHVQSEYKLDSGDQLVAVRSGKIALGDTDLGVAVRPKGGELELLEGDGLLYILAGLEPGGTLPGKASKPRGQVLMREALELALYSFRYLDDVTMVAVMLPPSASAADQATSTGTQQQSRVVFYRPGDLLEQLQVPLTSTLPAKVPTPKALTEGEAARIDSLTLRNLFLASIQPLDSDLSYLVLTEPDTIS
jgi:hypothetical protein